MEPKIAYRTLVIVRPFNKIYKTPKRKRQLQPLSEEDVVQLMILQSRWRQIVNDILTRCNSNSNTNIRCIIESLKNVRERPYVKPARKLILLDWIPEKIKRKWKAPMWLDANTKDNSEIYLDLERKRIAIRIPTLPYTYIFQLNKKEIEWIQKRFEEGAEFTHVASLWIDPERRRLNIALPFRRKPTLLAPKRLLVVDVNAVHNGLAYAVMEKDKVLERSVLRPPLSALGLLHAKTRRLDRICSKEGRLCEKRKMARSKFYRILREFEKNAVKRLIELALQYKAAVVVDTPIWESLKELKERGNLGVKKQFLNVGKFLRRLGGLAEWYGVPYVEERLFSTYCPRCNTKLKELNGRKMYCPICGLMEERDRIPLLWAQRRYTELMARVSISSPSQPPSFSSALAYVTLL
ncbi:MAG: zinc ribbon domain-containing protein [Thermoproteus sp.]